MTKKKKRQRPSLSDYQYVETSLTCFPQSCLNMFLCVTTERKMGVLSAEGNAIFLLLLKCVVQCSPYQSVTDKIYRLKQQFL